MPPLESVMKPLRTAMPAFDLPDCNGGGRVTSATLAGRPVLVMFLCNHCPYVKHLQAELARLGRDLRGKAITIADGGEMKSLSKTVWPRISHRTNARMMAATRAKVASVASLRMSQEGFAGVARAGSAATLIARSRE